VAATVGIVHVGSLLRLHDIYTIPPGFFSPFTHFISQIWQILTLSWEIDMFTDFYQQLWTIPAEFACSMVLFVYTVGVCGMRPLFRLATTVVGMGIGLFSGHPGVALFLSGWLIAETEYMFEASGADKSWHSPRYYAFWFTVLVAGMVLGSYPSLDIGHDMLLSRLTAITPTSLIQEGYQESFRFWLAIAAVMVVWPLFRLPRLQGIFTTRLALYLGDISYSVYLMHYQVVVLERNALRLHADRFFGKSRNGHVIRMMGWSYEIAILLFLTTWSADVCWRYVDEPSVKFAKWVESRVRKPPAKEGNEVALLPIRDGERRVVENGFGGPNGLHHHRS
jgi:peptidoglycan/LPS O-acetylase OafA/YrhL